MMMQPKVFQSRLSTLCLVLVGLVFAGLGRSCATEIYVSVDGRAQADGSLAKPYGSLPAAVEAVRALRKAGNTEPVKIILREGRHQLSQTLVLGLEDGSPSGSKAEPLPKYGVGESSGPAYLTIAAYPGENPVVSAGVPVTGWRRVASAPAELPAMAFGELWVADIPAGLERFYTLYGGQGRLNRARGDGFLPTRNGDRKTLHFPEGALKNWDNVEDVEIQVRPSRAWVINMLPLASVDEADNVAQTSVSATYGIGALPAYLLAIMGESAASVWVENCLEELDEPGEWVVNTKTRKIYLWPSDPAPDGSPRDILASTTTELIRVEGQIDYEGPMDTPVRGIAFSGLTFSHADRWAWTSDEGRVGWGMQHDWDMFDRPTALLRLRGAEDCRVTDCKFIHSGGSGIRLDLHAQRNRIANCELAHLGEAGILLAGYGPGTKNVNHHNDIINNHIHHFSEITWHSPGIWAWQSGHNRMVHNELSYSGYSAVLITTRVSPGRGLDGEGGRTVRRHEIAQDSDARAWGAYESWKRREKYNHSRHNLFEYNEISHSVQLLSDGNGIYISGTGTGNVIRYNYLHHNQAHSLPAAIRCDDDQHETLIHGNVLYKNRGHAAAIASKGTNDIVNNFIVAQTAVPRWGYISFEWAPVTGSKVERNIVISHPEGGNAYAERLRRGSQTGGPKLESTEMDKNLYFHPTDSHWMDEHLLKMRAAGREKDSRFGDPLFVDPAGGDFSFQPDSPALGLVIEPLDVSKMGRLDDRSLLNSDGSRFLPKDFYPEFSWDTTPRYFMFGDKNRVLNPEQVRFIAEQTDFLCIEKSHGMGELGAAELGAKHEAAAFKKIKPGMKVLFYFNAAFAWPYTSYNEDFTPQRIDAHPELKAFLITHPKTGELVKRFGVAYCYDVLNPDFRDWWVKTVAKGVKDAGCDGAFIDQMHGNIMYRNKELGPEVEEAMGQMMAALKQALGPGKILLANNAYNDDAKYVYPVSDAVMFENYARVKSNKESLLAEWGHMLKHAKDGKISVFRLGVEGTWRGNMKPNMPELSKEKLEFALACYLIGAQPYSYFLYSWGWKLGTGALVDYPDLKNPLGPPKGAYQRTTPEGWEFTRDFEHASVWVNTETRQAKITWR